MANNWAIVIGINHYDHHPERQLKYAIPDAQLIHDFLCTHAGFAPDRTLLCLGDEDHRNSLTYPTCATLMRILNRDLHPKKIGKVDRLWFFFGGHGVSRNGRDYLLPTDNLLEDIELRTALPVDEVIAALRQHQTADIVLVLDSCRQLQGSRGLVDVNGEQTIKLARNRGITTIFSCDYGQHSYELDSLKQGAFTYALVEGLKQHTLPNPLEQYLQRRVAELNRRNDQIPRILVAASKASQPLLPNAVTPADVTVLIDRARESELDEDFETAKQLWWQIVEVSQSGERIREARTVIERIDRKIARLEGNRSTPKLFQPVTETSFSSTKFTDSKANKSHDDNQLSTPVLSDQSEIFTDGLAGLQALTGVDLYRPQLITSKQVGMAEAYALQMKRASENAKKFYEAAADISAYSTSSANCLPPSNLISPPASNLIIHPFKFEVVTVDAQGKETDRRVGHAEFFVEDLGNGITLEMVKILGGSFKMGSPDAEKRRLPKESPQHTVTVPSFFIGKFVVTQAQYQAIMNNNPAKFKGQHHPVEQVSWDDTIEFCAKLSRQSGRTYRLPSEAEWEYACRANTNTPFHFGENITPELVNYACKETTPVGHFRVANSFGLYDMHGNVWEWCMDQWHDTYERAPTDGSARLGRKNNQFRLARGGAWSEQADGCRSTFRRKVAQNIQYHYLGFRVACSFT